MGKAVCPFSCDIWFSPDYEGGTDENIARDARTDELVVIWESSAWRPVKRRIN